jgi:hypothetical protein
MVNEEDQIFDELDEKCLQSSWEGESLQAHDSTTARVVFPLGYLLVKTVSCAHHDRTRKSLRGCPRWLAIEQND